MWQVNQIIEECDWVTHFNPEEIVNLIANILQDNPSLITEEDVTEQN